MTLRNLRTIRVHCGLSQEVLSQRADVRQSHVSYLERGAQPIDQSVVTRLADALGVPPSALTSDILLRADRRVELAEGVGTPRPPMAYSA